MPFRLILERFVFLTIPKCLAVSSRIGIRSSSKATEVESCREASSKAHTPPCCPMGTCSRCIVGG
jgi:hypothetical protein